ncbi:MAG TPA: aldehyde reductase [Kofleriaceae bacterium]|jgi:dihydroflavonol-4-reductase
MENRGTVLVTGGTGFIAQYCMIALLNAGYRVRTTVRSLSREAEVRGYLRTGGVDAGDRLTFVVADLSSDAGWSDAAAGCDYAIHPASPTPSGDQVREEDWVKPAVDGNLRVLRAARDVKVKRVVLTSAFGAIGMGHPASKKRPFTENDWTNLAGDIAPYQKSKTLSEKASWDFIEREGNGLELSSVNPVAVLGPALGTDHSHSVAIIKNLLDGKPCPKINSSYVDVRDVADLHVRAMTDPAAKGQRFLASAGESLWMVEVGAVLRRRLGSAARKVKTWTLPSFVLRLLVRRNPTLRNIIKLVDYDMNASGDKARRLLGWSPRSSEDAIVAAGESLVRLGLVG